MEPGIGHCSLGVPKTVLSEYIEDLIFLKTSSTDQISLKVINYYHDPIN